MHFQVLVEVQIPYSFLIKVFPSHDHVGVDKISDLVQSITNTMSGYVPSNYYCRLRTSNILSTPTFTYQSGQEILL